MKILNQKFQEQSKDDCFVALLGTKIHFYNDTLADEVNVYMTATPVAKGVKLYDIGEVLYDFRKNNPHCVWVRLVTIEEIIEFNSYGEDFGIGIRKAKTSSTYVDHHGRAEFQYCWDNGKKRDDNSDVSDVYLTFALKANEPQFIRYKKTETHEKQKI